MKIKNLKYIFGVVFGCFFFVCNVSFGACSSDMSTGTRSDMPGNGQHAGACWSNAGEAGNAWYDNKQVLSDGGNLFLKMIGRSWIECNDTSVKNFQTVMQQIGGSCSTCIDGRAGHHTRDAMENPECHKKACPDPNKVPRLEGEDLVCDAGYKTKTENGITCCVKMTINGPSFEKQSREDNDILTVYVTFNVESPGLIEGSLHCDSNKFNVDGGTLSEVTPDSYSQGDTDVGCVLEISTPDSYEVTVTANEGIIKMGESESSNGSDTFTREEPEDPCPNPPDSNGACQQGYVLGDGGCCEESACSNPPSEDGTCSQQGYVVGAGGCCEPSQPCTGNQYQTEGGCQACTGDTIPNSDRTKCVCDPNKKCCGIQLNTVVPFIGDCIEMSASTRGDTTSVTSTTAFPILMQGLMKILMSAIMVFSFLMVIVAGLSMTTGAFGGSGFTKGKTILKNVIISLILLGCSGLILSLVNPSFFGR